MLGSVSSPVFAAVMAELFPVLRRVTSSTAGGIALSAVTAELAAIACISLPVYLVIGWRKRAYSRHEVEPVAVPESAEIVNPALTRRMDGTSADSAGMMA